MLTKRLSPFTKVVMASDIPKAVGKITDYLVCVEYHTIYECQENALTVDNIKVFYTAEGTYSTKRWVGVAGQNDYYLPHGFSSSHLLWLSQDGNDSNTGLYPDVPKRTIGAAVAAVIPDASNRWTIVCLEDASFSEITAVTWKRWLNLYVPNSSVAVNFIINVEDCRFVMRDFINVSTITNHISCGNNIADGAQAPIIECDNWLLSGTGAQNGYYPTATTARCVIKVKSEMRLNRVRGIFSDNINNNSLYFECPHVNIQGVGTIFLLINSMYNRYNFNVQRIIGSSSTGQVAIQGGSGGNPFYATFNGLQEINMSGTSGVAYNTSSGVKLQLGDCRVIVGTKTLTTGATVETTLANRYLAFTQDLPNQNPVAVKDAISILQDGDGYIKYCSSENIAGMTIGKGISDWEKSYFVAENGDNSNSGFTAATPFCTIEAALEAYLAAYLAHLGRAIIIVLPGYYSHGREINLRDFGNDHIINIYFCEGVYFVGRYNDTEFTSTIKLRDGGRWNLLGYGVFERDNASVDPDKVTTISTENVNAFRLECKECGRIYMHFALGASYVITRTPIIIKANKLLNGFCLINECYGSYRVCNPKIQIEAELMSNGFIRIINGTLDSNIKLMQDIETIEILGVNPKVGATAPIYWRHKGDIQLNFNDSYFIHYKAFSNITKIAAMACDIYIDGNIYVYGDGTPLGTELSINNAIIKTYNGSFVWNGNMSLSNVAITYDSVHNYFDMHAGIGPHGNSKIDIYLNDVTGQSTSWDLNSFDVYEYEYYNTLATTYKKIVHSGRRDSEFLGSILEFPIGTKVICTSGYRLATGNNYHVDIDRKAEQVATTIVGNRPPFPDIFAFGLAKAHYRNLNYRSKATTEFDHRTVLLQDFVVGQMQLADSISFLNAGGAVYTAPVILFDDFTQEIVVTVESGVWRMANSADTISNARTANTHFCQSGILVQNVHGNERVFIGNTESINIHDILCWSSQYSNAYHRGLITILPATNMLECLVDNIDMHIIPTAIYDDDGSGFAALLRLAVSAQQEAAGKRISLRRLNLTGHNRTRPLHISLFNTPVTDIEIKDSLIAPKIVLDFVYCKANESPTMVGSDLRTIGPKIHFKDTFLYCTTGGTEILANANIGDGTRGDFTMRDCKIVSEAMITNSVLDLLNESNTFVVDPATTELLTLAAMNDSRSTILT